MRKLTSALMCAAALLACSLPVQAQDTVRVGLILPLTGPFATTGRQIEADAVEHRLLAAHRQIQQAIRRQMPVGAGQAQARLFPLQGLDRGDHARV